MRSSKLNYVLVGMFVTVVIAIAVTTVATLSGRTGPTDTYYTSYDDATGLKFGSQVLYMGFPVGQVEALSAEFDDARKQVRFNVRMSISKEFASWQVPKDSTAHIRAAGLLAAVTIDIRAGRSDEALRPGDTIAGVSRTDVFGAVSETANTLRELTITDVKPLIENLNRAVSSFAAVVEEDAGPLVRNFGIVADVLARRAPDIVENFLVTTDEINRTSRSLREILSADNARKVGNLVDNVEASSAHLLALSENARRQLDTILGDASVARIDSMIENLSTASGDVRAMTADVGERVGRILSESNTQRVESMLARLDTSSAKLEETVEIARLRLSAMLDEENVSHVDATLASVDAAAVSLERTVSDVRAELLALLGPNTREKIDGALVNLSRASENVATLSHDVNESLKDVLTPETTAKVQHALESFAGAAGNVATLTADLNRTRAHLDRLLVTLGEAADENRPDVRRAVEDLRHTLETIAQHVNAVTYNLEGTSRNMFEFSRSLRQNPSLLLRGATPEDDARATSASGG